MRKKTQTTIHVSILSGLALLLVVGGVAYAGKRFGATGTDAPAAFSASNRNAINLTDNFGIRSKLVSLKLPAGSYLVSGQAGVFGEASAGGMVLHVGCSVSPSGGSTLAEAGATAPSTYGTGEASATVPLSFTYVSPTPRTISLSCSASWSGNAGGETLTVSGKGARLTAVAVGSIN